MTTNPNFSLLLDEAPTQVKRPKPLPVGTYLFTVGPVEYGKSSKVQTDFVRFPLKAISACDDVDADDLIAVGGLLGKTLQLDFYYKTDEDLWYLDRFHTHCGIKLRPNINRRQRNDECLNREVLAYVKHEQDIFDPESKKARINYTLPAD
ncbi:MAG: hypothetical protein ACREQ5_01165 [Candidatus Dormibacteria bacterium]